MSTDFRFIGIAPSVDLTERKRKLINDQTEPFTLDEMRGYKVFTALLTQSGGNVSETIFSGLLTIGVSYLLVGTYAGDDFRNVGGPLIVSDNDFNATYFIATGTTPNSWTQGTEISYNTGAPVATVLENTIGNVWFTYGSVGYYYIYNKNQFDTTKTTYTFTYANYLSYFTAQFEDGGIIPALNITTRDSSGTNIDSYLFQQPIEIRIYN